MLRVPTILAALAAALPLSSLFGAGFNPETGSLFFQYYPADQYAASEQNWAIAHDRRGIMYFGNTEGVLEFDGRNWKGQSMRADRATSDSFDRIRPAP